MLPQSRRFVAGCVLLFLAATSVSSAQERLRWKFEEGESTTYQIVQEMSARTSVAGQNLNQKMTQTMDLGWTVEDVAPDGTATLRQKIDRVQMTLTSPFANVEYDSSKEDQPDDPVGAQLAKVFDAMVGKEFTMKMSPRGDVNDVTLPEELEQALEGSGGGVAGAGFNADSLKQLVGQSNIGFPEEPVASGGKWNNKTEAKMPFGTMKIDNQFTYQGTEQKGGRRLHKIGVKPTLSIAADPNAEVQFAVKSQDATGTIYFDNRAGRISESSMKQKMELELMAGGQAIKQTMDQTMTMKLVPGK